jgi:glutamine amidotransferase
MCRLFGMTGGREAVSATFWLLQAPDSLAQQSHREPDGTGLGVYASDGRPQVFKQPIAAYADHAFAAEARRLHSRTFIAHIRYASNGAVAPQNTHPFEQDGRLFAHNGVIGEVDRLDAHLARAAHPQVHGETDSERFFALITQTIAGGGGDVGAAITRAAGWIAANLPVFALNCVLITASELFALRYPDTHELHVLQRSPGGPGGGDHLRHAGHAGTVTVHSPDLARHAAVVVASEPMDDDPGWRALEPGELLHVDADLRVSIDRVLPDPPARRLTLADLDPHAAASQTAR